MSSAPAPPPFAPKTPVKFSDSIWRPIVACGGALGVGALLLSLFAPTPASQSTATGNPEIVLTKDATLVVQPSAPPGNLMRGEIKPVVDAVGKAPLAGAVARQVVEAGARVKRGDPVVEISSGSVQRTAPRAEAVQSAAESSQIAASDAQNALAQKIAIAQTRLRAAGDRVTRAQAQVSLARDIVRRLQNGETVAPSEIPSVFRGTASVSPRPQRRKAAPRSNRAGEIALQQARAARDAADESARDLKVARQMLSDAQNSAQEADEKLKAATKNVEETENRFDDKKAGAADVEAARADQKEAQTASLAANRALSGANAEINKREKLAATAQSYATKAQKDATQFLGNAKLFEDDKPAESAPPTNGDNHLSLAAATTFAEAALRESRDASRDAEKINTEIAGYEQKVHNSSTRVENASQNLAHAQQEVMANIPKPRFTPVLAPASGVVTWISRLAREVAAGDSVFGVASGQSIGVQFEDRVNVWRTLKVGTTLGALALPPQVSTPGAPMQNPALNTAYQTPLSVRITHIEAPQSEGDPTLVSGEIYSLTSDAVSAMPNLPSGTEIIASVAPSGAKATLSLPTSSFLQRSGQLFVAVLVPSTPAANSQNFTLRWQKVQAGRTDGVRREILSGLSVGARIVALPSQLEEMGLSPVAISLDSQNKGAETNAISSPETIAVRLTGTAA